MMSNDELVKNVEALIKKSSETEKSEDAIRFSQAACNAANTLATLQNIRIRKNEEK